MNTEFPEWARELYEDYRLRKAAPKCKFEKVLTAVLRLHSFTLVPNDEGTFSSYCRGCGKVGTCETVQVIFETFKSLATETDPVHDM